MKKGFTLIELLAVIVILAILALIVSPIISGVITDAKKAAAERSMEGYVKAAEYAQIKYQGKNDGKYATNISNLSVEYSGNEVTVISVEFKNGLVFKAQATITGFDCKYENSKATCDKITPVADPVAFETDSWTTIANAVKTNNTSKYAVGNTKTVDLGDTYGIHTLRIANMSTPAECSYGGFSQTACGIVLEFTDVITTYYMNPSGYHNGSNYALGWNEGGYPSSAMHKFLQENIYNALPEELKSIIIDTFVVSSHGSGESTNFSSTDKLYLLSNKEVWNGNTEYDTLTATTRQLDYYKNKGITEPSCMGGTTSCTDVIKSSSNWWLRSAYNLDRVNFLVAKYNGDYDIVSAKNYSGVSPAFRIG